MFPDCRHKRQAVNRYRQLKTNKTFKYCKDLDKAYQSVHVNVEIGIKTFYEKRDLISLIIINYHRLILSGENRKSGCKNGCK